MFGETLPTDPLRDKHLEREDLKLETSIRWCIINCYENSIPTSFLCLIMAYYLNELQQRGITVSPLKQPGRPDY